MIGLYHILLLIANLSSFGDTVAGALFFRKNDEDVQFRHAGIVCALYKGTDKTYILDANELNDDIVAGDTKAAVASDVSFPQPSSLSTKKPMHHGSSVVACCLLIVVAKFLRKSGWNGSRNCPQ